MILHITPVDFNELRFDFYSYSDFRKKDWDYSKFKLRYFGKTQHFYYLYFHIHCKCHSFIHPKYNQIFHCILKFHHKSLIILKTLLVIKNIVHLPPKVIKTCISG